LILYKDSYTKSEEEFIDFMVKNYDLGLVQASAIFYKVKDYVLYKRDY